MNDLVLCVQLVNNFPVEILRNLKENLARMESRLNTQQDSHYTSHALGMKAFVS